MRGVYVPVTSLRQGVCALVEAALLVLSFVVATALRFASNPTEFFVYENFAAKAFVTAASLQLCLYYSDLYEEYTARRRTELYLRLGQAFLVGVMLLTLVYYAIPALEVGRGILAIFLPLSLSSLVLWRTVFFWVSGRDALTDSVLILGTGQSAQQIAAEMLRREPMGFRIVGFLGQHQAEVGRRLLNPSVVGTAADLLPIVERDRVNLIVVALEDRRGKLPVADLLRCRMQGIRVEEVTSFYERLTGKILVKNLRPSWLVFSPGFNKPRLLRNTKRAAEFVAAAAGLLLFAPILGLVALAVRVSSRGPVFYRQTRVGEKGKQFGLIKFRTMRVDAEASTGPVWATVGDDPRITGVGRLLRKTRLDELPQLLNVLRGEMAFVGPRPERPHFVETLRRVIPYYDERHSVKPGITGWAQIKFGYGSTIEDAEEKLQYDLYYIKHMSVVFDVGIVLDTMKVALLGKGAR